MRTTAFILVLTTFLVVSAHSQYNGNCGNYRYTIDGKLISSVEVNLPGMTNSTKLNTYYKIDQKNGYIWFWVEESEGRGVKTGKLISLWSRLSELDFNSFNTINNNPSEILVKLSSDQLFFFTTVYTTQKKGPQYEVRNKLAIRFQNEQDATTFINEVKQYIPKYN